MNLKPITKIITLGHSQHGKSTLAGYIYSNSLRLIYKNNNSYSELLSNVESIRTKSQLSENLRYALIYDGPRDDFYIDFKEGKFKTISTRPYTLQIEDKSEIFELTDLPGHQSFIDRVSGSLEKSNIGIMVIDAGALIDYLEDPKKHSDLLFKTVPAQKRMGTYPEAYLNMLHAVQEESKKKSIRNKKSGDELVYKTIKDKIKPPTIFGIYNYLTIALHLGIKKLIVAAHKMDLNTIRFSEKSYQSIKCFVDDAIQDICSTHNIKNVEYEVIPTSIEFGKDHNEDTDHNILKKSIKMEWYKGNTLLQALIQMKDEVVENYSCRAQTSPFRVQINDLKVENPSDKQGKHFIPRIFGYCHSGQLQENQKIILPIKNTNKFTKPIRVSSIATKVTKAIPSSFPDLHFSYYLSSTDIGLVGSNKDLKKVFFVGNFAIREDESRKNPLKFSNKIEVLATFIGGWSFIKSFTANLIYGYRRVQSEFTGIEIENNQKTFFANVKLSEIIPFCNEEGCGDTFKKIIIENNTFIVGVGTITRILPDEPVK